MAFDQRLLVGCDRCARVQERTASSGTLYIWFPLGHSLSKATSALQQQGISSLVDQREGYLGIDLSEHAMGKLVSTLQDAVTAREMEDSHVLHLPEGRTPTLADVGGVVGLSTFLELARADVLRGVLIDERITSYFQPIVSVGDPSRVFAHEALLRGIDESGAPISPFGLFMQARESGLLFQLDLAARRSAIINAVRHNLTSKLFVNFSPAAIYDPTYCLRTTVGAIREGGLDREQVVFEVIESDKTDDPDHLARVLDYYREAGFGVALDDVGAGYGNLNLLNRIRPDYMKLDMELIREVDQDPYKGMIAGKLLELAQELGIVSIVEGVETSGELEWARQHGADYAQGYFIARPAPEPRQSLASA